MRWFLSFCFLIFFMTSTSPLWAQPVVEIEQEIDFDSPEAWAMKYFASVSLLTALGPPPDLAAGAFELAGEAIYVPHLDTEQRTVGFGGFKEEDLNRSPIWARLRLRLGLGAGFAATLGWAPPVEVDGVEADLWSLALEKALVRQPTWSLGLRLYAQRGEAEGDLTCSAGGDVQFPVGSPGNLFGCEAPSSDVVTLDYQGAELLFGFHPQGSNGRAFHFGVAVNQLDLEFQVDALTFGFRDRNRLLSDGDTVSLTAGVSWPWSQRARVAVEMFYSDLDVIRSGNPESDPLINARALLTYRLR